MVAEMPDPLLLALKHQACRPEVVAARGASRASASLPYIRRRMDLAVGQRRRLFPDQRARYSWPIPDRIAGHPSSAPNEGEPRLQRATGHWSKGGP